ncbi:rod shape-determining protein MreC [Nonomuraea typhae]|uniref:rod shape-determining protein MreC n=1 Tax=Nonomuraea typhae TaxID=2603600 RepID=UPI0012FA00E7|nr:rod shape-determining protein MreC [Nonomuraea typhae]
MRRGGHGRLVVGALVLAAILLIAADRQQALQPLLTAGAAVAGPVERAVAGLTSGGNERIRALEQENARLKAELWTRSAQPGTPPGIPATHPTLEGVRFVAAQVIAYGGQQGLSGTVTIDTGTAAGVRPDLTVVNGDGLVGRVVAAGPDTATVLLATDATSVIGARLAGAGEVGTVTGGGKPGGLLELSLLDSAAGVAPGQRVVTFGSRRMVPFAPGVPIGTVVSVGPATDPLTRTALVRPAARLTALDAVAVVIPP